MNKDSSAFKAYAVYFTMLLIVASMSTVVLVAYDLGGLIFAFVTAHCPDGCLSSKCDKSDSTHVAMVILYFLFATMGVLVGVGGSFLVKEGLKTLYDKVREGL